MIAITRNSARMESALKPPGKIDFDDSNLSLVWKRWKEEFSLYVDLTMGDKTDDYKVKLLHYLIGEKGREVCKTIGVGPDLEGLLIDEVIAKLDGFCDPKKNETVERYNFFTRNQGQEESLDKYVTELRTMAATCNFGVITDSLIRDRIVCGTLDSQLRERLLREPDLSLEKCLQIGRAAELSRQRAKVIETQMSATVHAMSTRERQRDKAEYSVDSGIIQCRYCGRKHEKKKEKCPAFGLKCKACGKNNHFAAVCKSMRFSRKKTVMAIEQQDMESQSEDEILSITLSTVGGSINMVKGDKDQNAALYATLQINKKAVRFQLDCGATCNVIPVNLTKGTQLQACNQVLLMYNKTTLTPLGQCMLQVKNPCNGKEYRLKFIVVENNTYRPILGSKACQEMQLINVVHHNIMAIETSKEPQQWSVERIKQEYADVFEGDGLLEGKLKLEIDEQVEPVKLPKRRIPTALYEPLKKELIDLQRRGIIAPVEQSTDWISSMVVVQKPSGKLRVCIDPKPLNKALKRHHYPLPTIEDVLPDLNGARVFSVCDVKNGFWHIQLEEKSSLLTTFATPMGRYRWLRLPMGISPAPEIFQRKLNQVMEGIPGVKIIADDILVIGKGDNDEDAIKDHDNNLRILLDRCRTRHVKLNPEKMRLRLKEVPYIGHLLTSDGVKVDPGKVSAITQMPRPTDTKGVQRLLGMINYLAKFCSHASDLTEPLRQLTQKDAVWEWSDSQEQAFEKIKKVLSQTPVLRYYDPSEQLVLQCDASESGLGAALLQGGQPIAYASRALTETEKGYAQIEKELLAVVYGMERFHHFTYGRSVDVQSDHKPLESIMTKPLLSAPKRLQRMLMRLQWYQVRLQYCPGKHLLLADTLSRAYCRDQERGKVESEVESINMVTYLPVSKERTLAIQRATELDTELQSLKNVILQGWPEGKEHLSMDVTKYFHIRDELSVQNGIIFRGERVIVPSALRWEVMQRIHSSHIGIEGCLRRARECV